MRSPTFNIERRAFGARWHEWQQQKTQLRTWFNAAKAAGDKTALALLQETLTAHNRGRPTDGERQESIAAYQRRVVQSPQNPSEELAAYQRFQEIDRLMRHRYGVNVGSP